MSQNIKVDAWALAEELRQVRAENAALRKELEETKKAFVPTFVRELHAECLRLERENAALREDKARLDHLLKELAGPRPFWQWHNWTREQMIVALDAERARKEAQP